MRPFQLATGRIVPCGSRALDAVRNVGRREGGRQASVKHSDGIINTAAAPCVAALLARKRFGGTPLEKPFSFRFASGMRLSKSDNMFKHFGS